jgi:hypothetical protein
LYWMSPLHYLDYLRPQMILLTSRFPFETYLFDQLYSRIFSTTWFSTQNLFYNSKLSHFWPFLWFHLFVWEILFWKLVFQIRFPIKMNWLLLKI